MVLCWPSYLFNLNSASTCQATEWDGPSIQSDRIQTITASEPPSADRRGFINEGPPLARGYSLNQNGCYTSESDRYLNNDDLDGDGDFNSRDHCNGKSNNIQGFPLHSLNCQILSDQKIENCYFE